MSDAVQQWWHHPAAALSWRWAESVHMKHDELPNYPPIPPASWPVPSVGDRVTAESFQWGTEVEVFEVAEVVWDYFTPKIYAYLKEVEK